MKALSAFTGRLGAHIPDLTCDTEEQIERATLSRDIRILSLESASEAGVLRNLSAAMRYLVAAQCHAEASGYGDQFRGALNEAIAEVECVRGMLA